MTPRHLVLVFLALLAVAPLALPPFYVTLLNYIGLYAMVALGLVLLTGVGGLTSFGQAAFVYVGDLIAGSGAGVRVGVAHRHRMPDHPQRRHVVFGVPDHHHAVERQAVLLRDALHGAAFAGARCRRADEADTRHGGTARRV